MPRDWMRFSITWLKSAACWQCCYGRSFQALQTGSTRNLVWTVLQISFRLLNGVDLIQATPSAPLRLFFRARKPRCWLQTADPTAAAWHAAYSPLLAPHQQAACPHSAV